MLVPVELCVATFLAILSLVSSFNYFLTNKVDTKSLLCVLKAFTWVKEAAKKCQAHYIATQTVTGEGIEQLQWRPTLIKSSVVLVVIIDFIINLSFVFIGKLQFVQLPIIHVDPIRSRRAMHL